MKNSGKVLFFFLCAVIYFPTLAQTPVVSDFSTDIDGWSTANLPTGTIVTPTYQPTGGNPAGYISLDRAYGSSAWFRPDWFFIAPAKFLGNHDNLYNQKISFDLRNTLNGGEPNASDASNPMIEIIGTGGTIVYPVTTFPIAASWTSYSITINETAGWKYSNLGGTVPTKAQVKQILSNITNIYIRAQYLGNFSTGQTYSCHLDNVAINFSGTPTPPSITSFSPTTAVAGTPITITGTNFNATPAMNAVYFNGVKASVTSGSATQLIVKVPVSAGFGSIAVADVSTGAQGTSPVAFKPLFDNNKDYRGQIIRASMSPGYKTFLPMSASQNNSGSNQKGDFDGDGWIDMIVSETGTNSLFAYRNLGTIGSITAASFSSQIILPGISAVPGGSPGLGEIVVGDFDNDGMLDVASTATSTFNGFFAIWRNISTPGNILFASPQFFQINYYGPGTIAAGDLDGDGRLDLLGTSGNAPSNAYICQNLSTPGSIDFAYGNAIGPATSGYSDLVIGDINGDHKPEVIACGYNASNFFIYENNSTPGSIVMKVPVTYAIPSVSNTQAAIADLDGDNKLDLIWGQYGLSKVFVGKNVYTGPVLDGTAFSPAVVYTTNVANIEGVATGDMNGDGKIDIIATGYYDAGILQNIGAGGVIDASTFLSTIFQGSAAGQVIALCEPMIADFDGDNKLDIASVYTGNGSTNPEKGVYIFHNENFPVPVINSVSPASGSAGDIITVTGDLLKTGASPPNVTPRISGIISSLSSSTTNTSASVTIGPSNITGNLTLTEHGLTSASIPLKVSFGTNRTINTTSFGPPVDFPLAATPLNTLVASDFDDDGKPDVALIDNNGRLYHNTATAGQAITTSSMVLLTPTFNHQSSMVALDIDGDGKIDLNSGSGLMQNTSTPGNISFASLPAGVSSPAGSFINATYLDYNKDGKLDLTFVNAASANMFVYRNMSINGPFINNGNFSTFDPTNLIMPKPGLAGAIVAADFDGDGYDDILSSNPAAGSISYFLNKKQPGPLTATSFQLLSSPATTGTQPVGMTAKDFDNDGKVDIAVTYNTSAFVSVYRNTSTVGVITFAAPVDLASATKGLSIASQDLDGDGLAEIVVIHRPSPGPGSFSVFQNKSTAGTISFNVVVNYPLTAPARNPAALAIADINLDQKPDILIVGDPAVVGAGFTSGMMIFENKIPSVSITVSQQPSDAVVCNGAIATFTAAGTGTSNISYQWQVSTNGSSGPFTDIVDGGGYSNATTATLSVNTTGTFGLGRYRCKISGDFASPRFTNDQGLFISATSAPPMTTGNSSCGPAAELLSASGGSAGQYRWYSVATGGTAISGQTGNTYMTPSLTATTTYYVSVNNGTCESTRTPAVATITNCGVNSPPVITASTFDTQIGGVVTISLSSLISDPDKNLDLTTLKMITPPSSGASFSISADGTLTVSYQGLTFSGPDKFTIQVCDMLNSCSQQTLSVDVGGDIVIFNAVSPNADGKNDIFYIQFIDAMASTKNNKVMIFNRWGDNVFETENYDNITHVFRGQNKNGGDLPSGTYFYRIEFTSGAETKTGFLSLKR